MDPRLLPIIVSAETAQAFEKQAGFAILEGDHDAAVVDADSSRIFADQAKDQANAVDKQAAEDRANTSNPDEIMELTMVQTFAVFYAALAAQAADQAAVIAQLDAISGADAAAPDLDIPEPSPVIVWNIPKDASTASDDNPPSQPTSIPGDSTQTGSSNSLNIDLADYFGDGSGTTGFHHARIARLLHK